MSALTPRRLTELAVYAGELALPPLPAPGFIDEHGDVFASAGVYVIATRADHPLYSGSARRPMDPQGLVHRMLEHRRRQDRRLRWLRAWLIPMSPRATLRQVQLVEGMVGRDLGCPENRRLPNVTRNKVGAGKGAFESDE